MSLLKEKGAKEPVLQVFVRPLGLPASATGSISVAVHGDDDSLLASTHTSSTRTPLFKHPIELWGSASGKEAPQKLTFKVLSGSPARSLAEARITSNELRKYGLYNPREGAAIALPLQPPDDSEVTSPREPLASGAALHCYVHVGYSVRRGRSQASMAGGAALGASSPGDGTDSGGGLGDSEVDAGSGEHASRRRSAQLRVEHAMRSSADPHALLLHVRGWNASQRLPLRVCNINLRPTSPHWQAIAAPGTTQLCGALVPPRGHFEATFVLRCGEQSREGGSGAMPMAAGNASAAPPHLANAVGASAPPPVLLSHAGAGTPEAVLSVAYIPQGDGVTSPATLGASGTGTPGVHVLRHTLGRALAR